MGERAKNFMGFMYSSEMFCSLKFEDMRGCPYNSFTPRSITALSSCSVLIAIASLIAGM